MVTNLFDPLKKITAEALSSAVTILAPDLTLSLNEIYNLLVLPPDKKMGDLAFGVFTLSKALKLPPPAVAQKLVEQIKSNSIAQSAFSDVLVAGPYVNFKFNEKTLNQNVLVPAVNGSNKKQNILIDAPKTMVEFSQPNTHKELHVGHMRNACLGDALVRLMKYVGYPVITSTFPGDVGTHVAKCLWYLKFHNKESIPKVNKGEWLGKIYSKAHLKLEDEVGTPQEEKNREQLTLILKQLEAHSGEYFDQWKETRQWSIDLMNEVYAWCNIKFDHWYWESDVDAASAQYVRELFKAGKLVESEGAVGMDLSDQNLGFCLLLKSDGNGLYATKDIELAKRKFLDHKIEKSIYVVDMRQALHFKQVFAVLDRIGFQQSKGCYHLQYNFVELPDGAMSSRKGNIVPLVQLTEEMQNHVKSQYLARYQQEWSQDEIQLVAKQVAMGAIKYGMLRIDTSKKIVFDMAEWLKIDGESGPYIQYAAARIQSLIKKFQFNANEVISIETDLTHPLEKDLLMWISQFNQTALQAAENYKPHIMCNYLYDLAKKFSSFYTELPIGNAENPTHKQGRLLLSQATLNTLKSGLELLGIPVPERM